MLSNYLAECQIDERDKVNHRLFWEQIRLAGHLLEEPQMSSLDNIYMKMAPAIESASLAQLHSAPPSGHEQKQIGLEVAHELNNILTIIRGYADRMLLKHGDNPALRPDLQLIAQNATRAIAVVRQSTPPRSATAGPVG